MRQQIKPAIPWTFYLISIITALAGVSLLFPVVYERAAFLQSLHNGLPPTLRTVLAILLIAVGPALWRLLQRDDRPRMRQVGEFCLTVAMLVLLAGFVGNVLYSRFVLNSRYEWAFVLTKWAPEAGLAGVPVTLQAGERTVASVTSDAQGNFCFSNLAPATYSLTTPGLATYTPTTRLPLSVQLPEASAVRDLTIGLNRPGGFSSWLAAWRARSGAAGQAHASFAPVVEEDVPGTLCGTIFSDNNRNGLYDAEGRECTGWLACGLAETIRVTLVSLVLALVLGTAAGTARTSKNTLVNGIATVYVQFFRNTPLVVQLFLWFVGTLQLLRLFHVELALIMSPFAAGAAGLGFYTGAYMSEAIRAGILAVDRGQWEAAHAIGLTPLQTLSYIVLPQAFRIVVPPLTSQFVNLWKNSTVVMTVGVTDLLFQAREIGDRESHVFEILTAAVAIYVIGTLTLSFLMNYVNFLVSAERRRSEGAEPDRIRRVLRSLSDGLGVVTSAIGRFLGHVGLSVGERLAVVAAVVGLIAYFTSPWVSGLLARQFLNVAPAPALAQAAAIGPNWADLSAGRDVTAEPGGFDSAQVAAPGVVLDRGLYKLWYSGYDGQAWRVGFAQSGDGIGWRKERKPAEDTGESGTVAAAVATGPARAVLEAHAAAWDATSVAAPAVLVARTGDQAEFRLWYAGRGEAGMPWQIGYGTSTDGLAWLAQRSEPVLPVGAAGAWDAGGIWSPSVVQEQDHLRLWYAGTDGRNWAIGTATSVDGLVWQKDPANPILQAETAAWDSASVAGPAVVSLPEGGYELWYLGSADNQTWRVSRAFSEDGITWTRQGTPAPDLTAVTLPGGEPPAQAVLYRDGVYRLWLDQPASNREAQHIGAWSQTLVKLRYRYLLYFPPVALLAVLLLIGLRLAVWPELRLGEVQTALAIAGLAPAVYLGWLILGNNARDVSFSDLGSGAGLSIVALLVLGAAAAIDLLEQDLPRLARRKLLTGLVAGLAILAASVIAVGSPPSISLLNRGVPVVFGMAWSSIWNNLAFFLRGQPGQVGGLELTFLLAIVAISISFVLGTVLGAMRLSKYSFVKWPAVTYIELVRGTPLLMLIFYTHLSLPLVIDGLNLAPWQSGMIALTAFTASYIAEITRAGIQSIDRGQWEAAHSLGLHYVQTLLLVILPQAIKRMIPPTVSQFIALFKDTSLVFVIGAIEFFRAIVVTYQREIQQGIGSTLPLLLFAAAVYFVFAYLMSLGAESIRKRMGAQERA